MIVLYGLLVFCSSFAVDYACARREDALQARPRGTRQRRRHDIGDDLAVLAPPLGSCTSVGELLVVLENC